MEFNLRVLVLTVGCLCFLSRPIHGAGKYLQVEYPPSTAANQLQIGVTYIMWVPDDVARFRCVIVHQHGAGRNAAENGFTAAYDLHWQAWLLGRLPCLACALRHANSGLLENQLRKRTSPAAPLHTPPVLLFWSLLNRTADSSVPRPSAASEPSRIRAHECPRRSARCRLQEDPQTTRHRAQRHEDVRVHEEANSDTRLRTRAS